MERVSGFFDTLTRGFRLADVADIVVVAVLAYVVITWFRAARSRFVVIGVGLFLGLYFVALASSMHLTIRIFQALVTVALVALVVIFQEEIRRTFERIATRGPRRAKGEAPAAEGRLARTVATALGEMARGRIGALVVFRGKEPLERHLSGGVRLDGEVSEPLLYSVFDHHSAGHDGAMVIESGRASRFGVHLPLSARVGARPSGTRHTAALGLSERSDALLCVVSEERGVISIAHRGELEEVPPDALETRILSFLRDVAPEASLSEARRLFSGDLRFKLLALGLAVVAWTLLFVERTEVVTRAVTAGVVYEEVSEDWVFDPPKPNSITLTLTGPRESFDRLPPELTVPVSVTGVHEGTLVIPIAESAITLPEGLTIEGMSPREVAVEATQMVEIDVGVDARTTGKVAQGFGLVKVTVEPRKLRIAVPKRGMSLRRLSTELVSVEGMSESTTLRAGLVLPEGARLSDGAVSEVEMKVEIAPIRSRPPVPEPPDVLDAGRGE